MPSRTISINELPPFQIEVHGANDEFVAADIMNGGAWEPFETEVIRRCLDADSDFYDVGANIGWYSVVAGLCLMNCGGSVHAFEPALENVQLLAKNVTANGLSNIRINPCALGGGVGPIDIHLCATNKGDHRVYACESGRAIQPGSMTRFDQYYAPSTRRPFIKMDTQGFELAIVEGMGDYLSSIRQLVMLIEFWPKGLGREPGNIARLIHLLSGAGFKALTITEDDCHVRPTDWSSLSSAAETTLAPATNGFVNLLLYREGDPIIDRLQSLYDVTPSRHVPKV